MYCQIPYEDWSSKNTSSYSIDTFEMVAIFPCVFVDNIETNATIKISVQLKRGPRSGPAGYIIQKRNDDLKPENVIIVSPNYYPSFFIDSEIEDLLCAIERGQQADDANKIAFNFADREWFIEKNTFAELSDLRKKLKALNFENVEIEEGPYQDKVRCFYSLDLNDPKSEHFLIISH